MDYEFHPLAEAFPMMDSGDIDKLAEDIRANGQIVPAYLLGGKILDGRNRYMACTQLGIPLTVTNCEDEEDYHDDPVAFVTSLNLHRRHMTPPKRSEAIAELRKTGMSMRQIAAAVGVSAPRVQQVLSGLTPEAPDKIRGKDGKDYPARKHTVRESKSETTEENHKPKPRRKHFEDLPDEDAGELSEAETTDVILESFCTDINAWAGRLRNTKLTAQQVTRCRAAVNSLLQELI